MREKVQAKANEGAEPKRLRGRLRVAAILETAGALFASQGYDAVTMTEIAARSGTAIGSLYRFFPTKEILADALLRRYAERIELEMAALAHETAALPIEALADSLVAHALDWAPDRAAALVLIEARNIGAPQRERIGEMMRRLCAEIVARVNPSLSAEAAGAKALVLRLLFKLAAGNAGEGCAFADEMRGLMLLYLREMADEGRRTRDA